MMIVLYIYIAGAIFVALRLFRHMLFKLDCYDWRYNKGGILGTFVFFSVLWPFVLIKPQQLIDPTELFKDTFDIAGRRRERDQLWKNPPPCGSVIRYRQEYGPYQETYGEFLFRAADVERVLCHRLEESPQLADDDEGAILNWINRRSERVVEPTDVPSAWRRFKLVANDLVRSGKAEVHCLKCGMALETNQLVIKDDPGRPGWNYDRLACPHGHNLLVVERVHFLMKGS
jgi:hypothetical protein